MNLIFQDTEIKEILDCKVFSHLVCSSEDKTPLYMEHQILLKCRVTDSSDTKEENK